MLSKILNTIKKKWLINGTKTILLIAIIIAIYVGINIALEKFTLPEIDLTENKIYSLSEETISKVSNLENEITIQLINFSDYQYVIDFAKKYTTINKNIKVETIDDLNTRTDLMTEYNLEATDKLIVISSGDRKTTLDENDLYTTDWNTYEDIDTTEESLTNAILDITTENKPKVYISTGHTYYPSEYLSTITESIKKEANDVEAIDLLVTGRVPEDCNCLILTTIKTDLTELERDVILDYIKNGGKILMLTSQNIIEEETPNLQKVLDEFGISISKGIIFEQDSSKMLNGSPELVVTNIDSYSSISKTKMTVCLIDPGKINIKSEEELEELNVTYETLAQVSEKAFLRTDLTQTSSTKTDSDSDADSAIVATIMSKEIDEEKVSQLVIYSNEIFATDVKIPVSSQYYLYGIDFHNNKDAVLNTVAYLTEKTNNITIRKTSDSQQYTVTDQENTIIMSIIFILPVLIISTGIVIWYMRRRKK